MLLLFRKCVVLIFSRGAKMPYEFTLYLLAVLVVSPILTAALSVYVLPLLKFGERLLLSVPQAFLFALGAILTSRSSGLCSNWAYLTAFSIVFGQPLGFLLVTLVSRRRVGSVD